MALLIRFTYHYGALVQKGKILRPLGRFSFLADLWMCAGAPPRRTGETPVSKKKQPVRLFLRRDTSQSNIF